MTTKEIRALGIQGTQTYYNYLAENDKGLQKVGVSAIEALPKNLFKINITGALVDTEAIFFRFRTNNKTYNTSHIEVVSYDKNSKMLLLRPEESHVALFEDLLPKDLILIMDLKFLVERVKVWYEKNGGSIQLPSQPSILQGSQQELTYFEDLPPSPSQLQAIHTIFEAPLSYVWGAPGTGKTQGVLSYALLHYLSKGHKVAILGPTNNAIEQVLRGVIAMTDRAAIKRDKILRLGVPSKSYAEAYPETCEARGLLQRLEELEERANTLKKVLQYKNYSQILEVLEEGEGIFEEVQQLKDTLDSLVMTERQFLVQINGNKKKIERRHKSLIKIKNDLRTIERRSSLMGPKIASMFLKENPNAKQDQERLQKEFRAIEDEIDDFEAANELLEWDWEQANAAVEEQKAELEAKIGFIKIHLQEQQAQTLLEHLQAGRVEMVANAIQQIKKAYESNKVELGALAAYYEDFTVDTVQAAYLDILAQKEALAHYTTEERLKSVQVVATTLDGYIGRFMEDKLKVDHIFVDEAGYANLAKVLTLFNHRVPITLLGDHKQLPPVCEINDQRISKEAAYHDAFIWSQSAIFVEGVFHQNKLGLLQDYVSNAPLKLYQMRQANLNQTFRFGQELAQVLEHFVYQNGFSSALEEGSTGVYYWHAPKPTHADKKRENAAEVAAIEQLLPELETVDFAILTPYRNQLMLLGRHLPRARRNQQILTVHGSQGREWHTVILSLVDTYDKWFTDSQNELSKGLNLINTAVSRAKKRLIIVGDLHFWSRQQGQLLQGLVKVGTDFRKHLLF